MGYSNVAFSDKEDKLLAYDESGEIPPAVWELKNGRKLQHPILNRDFYNARFSPDGTKVVTYNYSIYNDLENGGISSSISNKNTISVNSGIGITLWDLVVGDTIQLENNVHNFDYASFSSDGRWLLAYDGNEEVMFQLWDTTNWKNIELEGNFAGLEYIYFSKDGSRLAAFKEDGMLIVWDLTLKQPKLLIKANVSAYNWTNFTPDSNKIKATATSGGEVAIKIWNLETGKTVEFDKVTGGISEERFISEDHLLIEHQNGMTNIFDLSNGNIHELKSFRDKQFLGIHYNEKEKRLTTVTEEGLAQVMYTHPDSIIKEVNSRKGGVWKLDAQTRAKYGLSAKD